MSSIKNGGDSPKFVYPSEMPVELRDWVPHKTKGVKEKFKEKIKQNPLVPVGCALTATALTLGLFQFSKGRSKKSQTMMRFRVSAQAFTIGAMIIGVVYHAFKGTNTNSYPQAAAETLKK